jgi:uncharacterized membrane protein
VTSFFLRSTGIGVLAGMRTFAPSAWLVQPKSMRVRNFFLFAAAFETVFDKLPFVGNRTSPPQLVARVLSGAGNAIYVNRAEPRRIDLVRSGVIAALAAAVSTYTFFHLRKSVCKSLRVRDGFVGAAEDATSFALGRLLAR